MQLEIDEAAAKRLQAFSDKHCRGKVVRLDMLTDMCAALGLRVRVKLVDSENNLG